MKRAQSTIEFTFTMIAILFLIYGMMLIFRWVGMDLANRRMAQDNSLITLTGKDPASELNSDIGSSALPMDTVYHGSITDGNASQ